MDDTELIEVYRNKNRYPGNENDVYFLGELKDSNEKLFMDLFTTKNNILRVVYRVCPDNLLDGSDEIKKKNLKDDINILRHYLKELKDTIVEKE